MKEIKEIIKAFDRAQAEGTPTALATVVQVDGSSYRSPGARMLITEDGELTGAISGGCLEGDALKKAQLVMFQQQSMVVTYDTMDEDDAKFGVGLGCNGIIHVLIEPVNANPEHRPLSFLKSCLSDRQERVLVTLFDLKNKRAPQHGTCLLFERGSVKGSWEGLEDIREAILSDVQWVLSQGSSLINTYGETRQLTGFIELVEPPVSLIVVGAGNDAIPLAELANVLDWDISIVDGRAHYASRERFPKAKNIIVSKAGEVANLLKMDPRTVMVLMTHNYDYELSVLKSLFPLTIPYLGVLGPRKKLMKMLDALSAAGISPTEEELARIFGPVGLDIGADAPEEIALALLAEIKAVLAGKNAGFLRDKPGPIHEEDGVRKKKIPSNQF